MSYDLLRFIDNKMDGDPGTEIRKAVSDSYKNGIPLIEEGLHWSRDGMTVYQDVEPCAPRRRPSVVIAKKKMEVKCYDEYGNFIGTKMRRIPIRKDLEVSDKDYHSADTIFDRAIAVAMNNTMNNNSWQKRTRWTGRLAALWFGLDRLGIAHDRIDALCEAINKTVRGENDGDHRSTTKAILEDIRSSEHPPVKTVEWTELLETLHEELDAPETLVNNLTFDTLEDEAHRLGITAEQIIRWGCHKGRITGTLYNGMPEDGEEEPGDMFVEKVPGEQLWNETRQEIQERLEEREAERRAQGFAQPNVAPILHSGNIQKVGQVPSTMMRVPLYRIEMQHRGTMESRTYFTACFFDQLQQKIRKVKGAHQKINLFKRGEEILLEKGPVHPGYNVNFTRVKEIDKNGVEHAVSIYQNWTGNVTRKPDVFAQCRQCNTSSTAVLHNVIAVPHEFQEIFNEYDLIALANTPDGQGLRVRINDKWITAADMKFMLFRCAGKEFENKMRELVATRCTCKHCGMSGMELKLPRHEFGGDNWAPRYRIIKDFTPTKIHARQLEDKYAENVGNTWRIESQDWLWYNPGVKNKMLAISSHEAITTEHAKQIRAEIRENYRGAARRVLNSYLNMCQRRSLLNVIKKSEFIQEDFLNVFRSADHDNFHDRKKYAAQLLYKDGVNAVERAFGFEFMKALGWELRQSALNSLNEEDIETYGSKINSAGYVSLGIVIREISQDKDLSASTKFILREKINNRWKQLAAHAQETEVRNQWKEALRNNKVSSKNLHALRIASRMSNDDEFKRLVALRS